MSWNMVRNESLKVSKWDSWWGPASSGLPKIHVAMAAKEYQKKKQIPK